MLHNDFRQMSMLLQNEHNVKRFLILAEGFFAFPDVLPFFQHFIIHLDRFQKTKCNGFS